MTLNRYFSIETGAGAQKSPMRIYAVISFFWWKWRVNTLRFFAFYCLLCALTFYFKSRLCIFISPRVYAFASLIAFRGRSSCGYFSSKIGSTRSAHSMLHNTSVLCFCLSISSTSGCREALFFVTKSFFILISPVACQNSI